MNIFDYEGKEFDKKLDEIFKNKSKEELKQELIECGLKVGVEMEEDIKYKKILNNRLDYLKCNYAITNEDLKAIKYLLNRNKELEEKNIKLQKRNNRQVKLFGKRDKEIENLKNTNKTLYELCQGKAMQEFINNECDYIPKSKVREKIKELEIIKKEHSKSFNWSDWEDEDVYTEIIAWFKELLQEGDK